MHGNKIAPPTRKTMLRSSAGEPKIAERIANVISCASESFAVFHPQQREHSEGLVC